MKKDEKEEMIWNHYDSIKREGPSIISYQQYIYVFGGSDPLKKIYDKSLHRFDTETKEWKTLTIKGDVQPRKCHSTVLYEKEVIIFGGMAQKMGEYIHNIGCLNLESLEMTELELSGDEIDVGRSKHACSIKDNLMYIIGGEQNKKSTKLNDFYEIDVKERPLKVKRLEDLPKKLFSIRSIINSKSIFTFGGINLGPHKDIFEYSFEKENWATIGVLPFGYRCSYSCQLLNEDYGLLFGGYNSQTKLYHNDFYKYHIQTNKWEEIEAKNSETPNGSAYSSSIMMKDNVFYLFGGYCGGQGN